MALYAERGYENTTVAEIAERAGLTERTFFRHFADKREVLFGGAGEFEQALLGPVANAAQGAAPFEAVLAGLEAVGALLEERREFARQRHAIIMASAELRERELIKLASLSTALAETVRRRGLSDAAARLTGEIAIAVFRAAFERWIDDANQRPLPEIIRDSVDDLRALTGVEPREPVGPREPAAGAVR